MTDFRVSQEGILGGYSGSDTAVTVPSTVTKVGYAAFRNMPIRSVILPAATTEIRTAAFAECSEMTSITVPDTLNLKFIAKDAFDGTQVLSQPYNPQVGVNTIQWTAPSNAPRTISSYSLNANGYESSVGGTSIQISQLSKGLTNTIQLAANDASGQGTWSAPFYFASTGMPWETSGMVTCTPAIVASSAIGNRIAVADVSSSSVAIYDIQSNETWSLTETLSGTGTVLSIAMGADGKTVVVARSTDVRIYTETAGVWSNNSTLAHPNSCVALSVDGQTIAVGTPDGDGSVALYKKRGGSWVLEKKLFGTMDSSELFGCSVALSADGSVVAVGAKYALGKGAVRVFSGPQWRIQRNLYGEEGSNEQFGHSVALSADGRTLAVGSPCMGTLNGATGAMTGHGRVTVWSNPTATWTKVETLYGADSSTCLFGSSVALNATGTTLLVSSGDGACVYAENAGTWPLVGAFAEAASLCAMSNTGDRIFCGSTTGLKSYTYRTARMNVVPSITTLLSAIRVQDAATAEAAAQNLLSDIIGFEQASDIFLSADFITQFAAALPSDASKKQASLAALLIAGNLLTETQNDLKAAITTACTSTLQLATDSYIGISQEFVSAIIQSADFADAYNPSSFYAYFPSSTSITVNPTYENVIFYLEPGVTYTAGSTTLNYRRQSEIKQLLLSLPNSATFTAPFRAPNPVVNLFGPTAQRYRLRNQYGQDSLLESATYWQQQIMASPATFLNYEMMAWISVDMLLSADTTTRQYGTALTAKFLPIARGLQKISAFNNGGEDSIRDSLPTGYFVGTADGSVAYPDTIVLTHTSPLKRIDAGAFDSSIRSVIINGQTFTAQNGNITLPFDATRIWSIEVNGIQILLPGAPTHIPAGGIIDISANVAYIPAGYFADCSTATHVRFAENRSTDMQVIGAGAFPGTCRLIVQGYNPSQFYYPYNTNGTNAKELTRLSGVFYSDYESNPVRVWYPPLLSTTDGAAVLPDKARTVDVFGVSGLEYSLPLETTSDAISWLNRREPVPFVEGVTLAITYGALEYVIPSKIPSIKRASPFIKFLQTYNYKTIEITPYTYGFRTGRTSYIESVTLPTTLKTYASSDVIIPFTNDFSVSVVGDSYIGDTLITQNFPSPTLRQYTFTNADLADGQVFYYGNLAWINSTSSTGLRLKDVLASPVTGGAVFLMPGAYSLYANMFGRWNPSVTSIRAYDPSMSLVTSIPTSTFKNCINLATHGFTFSDSIGASAFENCSSLITPVSTSSTGSMAIGAKAFKGCTSLTSPVTIDCSGAVSIGANAFKGCTGITSVTICGSSVSIDPTAFVGCTGITAISINGATVSIDPTAFTGCTAVQSIVVTGLTSSSPFPFTTMTGLQTVQIATAAAVSLPTMTGLTSLTVVTLTGSSALTIANDQFNGCSALQTLTISSPLTGMTTSALAGCPALQTLSLNFGSGAAAAINALTSSTALTSIQISGSGALTLPDSFCNGLTALTTVSLTGNTLAVPSSGNMFSGASALQTLTAVIATNPSAATFQVSGTLSALKTLSLTGAITVADGAFWENSVLESLTIRGTRDGTLGTLPTATIRDINVNHVADQRIAAYQYKEWPVLTNVNITPLVDISEGAFFGCTNLQTFNFDVTRSVSSWSFAKTGLSGEVVIPNTVTLLGTSYFLGCPNLRKIKYLCDVLLFNDPTTVEQKVWDNLMYQSLDPQMINTYYVTGSATILKGTDLSYNIVYAAPGGGTEITINNNDFFKVINEEKFFTRMEKMENLLKVLLEYYESARLYTVNAGGQITANLSTSSNAVSMTRYPITSTCYAEGIEPFILQLQDHANLCRVTKDFIPNFSNICGWNGTNFTLMDASADLSMSTSLYSDYLAKLYPSIATHFTAAIQANNDIFSVNTTDPSSSVVVPYRIPVQNCVLRLPQEMIVDIETEDNDIKRDGNRVSILWDRSNPTILFRDETTIDISGSLEIILTDNISSNYGDIIRWFNTYFDDLVGNSSVNIEFQNDITSIEELSNKEGAIIDIDSASLSIFDNAMTNWKNSILNIKTAAVLIGNGAFSEWSDSSTLNLDTVYKPCVGIDIFNDSDNIIVNSNQFLVNTPIVKLVDFDNATLDDVPALIEQHTDISANFTINVEIGTYMPPSTTAFPRGYAYIRFQEIPSLQVHILLQKPEDWFWAYNDGPWQYSEDRGQLKYINDVEGDSIFELTGLKNNFAPDSFSFMGYRFNRNVSRTSVTQQGTTFRAVKTNHLTIKKALFRNSGPGRVLYQFAPILVTIAIQLLVIGLTFGVGAAIAPITTPAVVAGVTAIVGGAAAIGGAFLEKATQEAVATGSFELGELTPLFWLEVSLGAASILFGALSLIGKFGGKLFKLTRFLGKKPPRWGKGRKFPKKPRWGKGKKLVRPPKPSKPTPGPAPPKPPPRKRLDLDDGFPGDLAKNPAGASNRRLPVKPVPPRGPPKPRGGGSVKTGGGGATGGGGGATGGGGGALNNSKRILDSAPDTPPVPKKPGPTPPTPNPRYNLKETGGVPDRKVFDSLDEQIKGLEQIMSKMNKSTPAYQRNSKTLADLKALRAAGRSIRNDTDLSFEAAAILLNDITMYMYLKNEFTSAITSKETGAILKANYSFYDAPTTPVTFSQYAEYTAQKLIAPILLEDETHSKSAFETMTAYEIPYDNAFEEFAMVPYPQYVFPVPGKNQFNPVEIESYYMIAYFQTNGTKFEHPYSVRNFNGYECKPARTAGPLLKHDNYLWKETFLGAPYPYTQRDLNNLFPGNLWHSYNDVILTVHEDINHELYLGNRTVEYTGTIIERPNLVYSGATNISVIIPHGITQIPDYAFNSTEGYDGTEPFTTTFVRIPPTVTNIGAQAFYRAGVKNLIYPSTATIGAFAFANSPIERTISLTDASSILVEYVDGNYNVSLVTNSLTTCVTNKVCAIIHNFTSAQITRNGVVVETITNGANKWLYLQNITSISEDGLTIDPKKVLEYTIRPQWGSLSGYATYDNVAHVANREATLPLIGTNQTTTSRYFLGSWYEYAADKPYAPFSTFRWNGKFVMNITFTGVTQVHRGSGTPSNGGPRVRDAAPVSIAPHAFMGNQSLTHCDISPYCTEIGESAFQGCQNLTELIVLPDGLVKISKNAFADSNIAGIVIPPTVTEIEVGAIPATANIVLLTDDDDEIAPGFLPYTLEHIGETNIVFCASTAILRRLAQTMPHSQLRLDNAPVQPVNVVAVPMNEGVTLSWEALTVPYSSGATSYHIKYSTTGKNGEETNVVECAQSPMTVSSLVNGQEYLFAVSAVNAAGASEPTIVRSTPEMAEAVIHLEIEELNNN